MAFAVTSTRSSTPAACRRTMWNAMVAHAKTRNIAVIPSSASDVAGSSSSTQKPKRISEPIQARSVNQRQLRKLASASTPVSSTST